MFLRKKNTITEENVAKQGIKKMDHVVTGLLLWGIIASIYGVKKLREKDQSSQDHSHDESITPWEDHAEKSSPEEKKQGILSRILFGNK